MNRHCMFIQVAKIKNKLSKLAKKLGVKWMNKDSMLSQEEIEALLNNKDLKDEGTDEAQSNSPALEDYLTAMEVDAIGELGNISFSSSATALSTLLNQKVEITTPRVNLVTKDDLEKEFPRSEERRV